METIDPKEIRQTHRQVTGAWERWEADGCGDTAPLRTTMTAAKRQLAAWETRGVYLGTNEVRLLRDQIATVEALLVKQQQDKQRGY